MNRILLTAILMITACGCSQEPLSYVFLSRPGIGSAAETQRYYDNIGAEPTLPQWMANRCFGNQSELAAFYYNAADLGLGREMRCTRCVDQQSALCPRCQQDPRLISCVVSNHGLPGDLTHLQDALSEMDQDPGDCTPTCVHGPAVAMDYTPQRDDPVRFYVYDGSPGKTAGELTHVAPDPQDALRLRTNVPLDSELLAEGGKEIRICLACHGGQYDEATDRIYGASFLDFDISLLKFSADGLRTQLATQHEALRQLNELVLDTDPAPAIQARIQGSYDPGVRDPGADYSLYVPPGWAATPEQAQFYTSVVHANCATCHFAQVPRRHARPGTPVYVFDTVEQFVSPDVFAQVRRSTCGTQDMPHSQLTRRNFLADQTALTKICIEPPPR